MLHHTPTVLWRAHCGEPSGVMEGEVWYSRAAKRNWGRQLPLQATVLHTAAGTGIAPSALVHYCAALLTPSRTHVCTF